MKKVLENLMHPRSTPIRSWKALLLTFLHHLYLIFTYILTFYSCFGILPAVTGKKIRPVCISREQPMGPGGNALSFCCPSILLKTTSGRGIDCFNPPQNPHVMSTSRANLKKRIIFSAYKTTSKTWKGSGRNTISVGTDSFDPM